MNYTLTYQVALSEADGSTVVAKSVRIDYDNGEQETYPVLVTDTEQESLNKATTYANGQVVVKSVESMQQSKVAADIRLHEASGETIFYDVSGKPMFGVARTTGGAASVHMYDDAGGKTILSAVVGAEYIPAVAWGMGSTGTQLYIFDRFMYTVIGDIVSVKGVIALNTAVGAKTIDIPLPLPTNNLGNSARIVGFAHGWDHVTFGHIQLGMGFPEAAGIEVTIPSTGLKVFTVEFSYPMTAYSPM